MPQRAGFPQDEEQILARPFELAPRAGGFPEEAPDPLGQTFGEALKQKPDQASRIFNLRLKTGLPPAVIERNVEAIEREVAQEGFDPARFRRESPLLAKWLEENPELAAIAQDDLEPLSAIERALQIGARSARALTTGPMALSSGAWGVVRAGAEWAGTDDLAEFARGSAAVAEHLRTRLRGDRAGAGGFESAVYGGLESLSLTATALPAAALGGAPALIAVLGGVTAGEAYTQAREEGRSVGRASMFALGQGAIEAATEFIPARWFLADLAQNAGFWRALKHQALGEIPGEQIATVLQDLNEWALVRQDGTFVDYLRERPSAAGETLVATIVAVGGQGALVRGLERVGGKPASAQVLEELHEAAAASKTRERAPEALRAFLERVTTEGLTHVYAPASSFTEYFQKQGEDPEALAAELTGNPDALRLANATNGDLAIPTAAYVSRIVGSGHESFFLNELRLSPDMKNARETQEAIAAEGSASTTVQEPADPSAPARAQIYQAMVEKLTATNRYTPQEVEAQARLYETVFGVLASRAGMDPLALFERFTPTLVSEGRPSDTAVSIDTGTGPGGIPASEARAGETPQQRETRRAGHLEALAAVLTRDAQQLDPNVDPAVIREELERRLAMHEEGQAASREGGRGQDLLRAIAGYGGVWWERRSGAFKGEIEHLIESGRDIRGVKAGTGRIVHQRGRATYRGVAGVFQEEGLTPDGMVEALRQDQRFEYIEDINALLVAIDEALRAEADVDTLPGTAELGELNIVPGTRWWADEEGLAEEALYGPLQQPAPAPNDRGETAYFIGWQESGLDDVAAIPLYNVGGGDRSGTTVSPAELDELGIPYLPPPEPSFDPTDFEQSAFHGSRHRFDRFSLHAIGTGEGHQAYGWGLYFASKREVAEEYREAGEPPGVLVTSATGTTIETAASTDARVKAAGYLLATNEGDLAAAIDDALERGYTGEGDALEVLVDWQVTGATFDVQPGRLYKVEIPEDEDFLEWDKPASQQSEKVKVGLRALGVEWDDLKIPTLKQALRTLNTKRIQTLAASDIGIREALREGHKHAESGNETAFRVWYGKHHGLLRAGGVIDPTGEQIYLELQGHWLRTLVAAQGGMTSLRDAAEAASKALAAQGVVGIRYLDGASRAGGEGTYNYVVFDDRLVDIVEFEQRDPDAPARLVLYHSSEDVFEDAKPGFDAFFGTADFARTFPSEFGKHTYRLELPADVRILDLNQRSPEALAFMTEIARKAFPGDEAFVEALERGDQDARNDFYEVWVDKDQILPALRRSSFDGVRFGEEYILPKETIAKGRGVRVSEDEGTDFRQSAPREARRAWLERRIREARADNREDFEANRLLQDLRDEEADAAIREQEAAPAASEVTPSADPLKALRDRGELAQGTKGTFNPTTRTIRLFKTADRSTFIHESAHLFLEVLSDLAAAPGATEQLQADMRTLLASFRFEGDLPAWRALTHEQRRDHHEEFARGFEKYLGEGKAPTPELQSLFARFRVWLLGAYRTLRRLNVELSADVRAVMDRMVATDEAIAAAEADAGVVALFTDAAAAGVSEAEFEGYREKLQAASDQARARLQARLLRELEREQEAWWQEQRAAVREEVAAKIYERPVYRAIAAMRGTLPDGSPLPEGTPATPLSKDFLVAQFGREILRKLPRPYLYAVESGLPPDTVAQIFGYANGEALIGAILSAPHMEDAIEAATDDAMLERHGNLLRDPDALVEQAREAIAGEYREVVIRDELAMLKRLRAAAGPSVRAATTDQRAEQRAGERAGAERLRTEMPDEATLQRIAKGQIAGMRLRDIRPDRFFAAARRHSRNATQFAAQQKFEDAVAAKQQELVNLALYREALAARQAVDDAREAFAKMFTPDAPMAKRRNMDYVHAARAIAATYFWPERRLESAAEALALVREHDPDLYDVLQEHIAAVRTAGTDLGALTFEAFQVMRETVDALWEQSRREQQMLVDGQLVDRNEAMAALEHRFDELGTPARQEPRTEKGMWLLGTRAALRRVEHWVDYVDGGDPSGPFRRFLWNPISEATAQYRIQRAEYLQKYLALVKTIETTLVPGTIAAPELKYTFESRAALLHAMLHTGNESNYQKLLRGYGWGALRADGTVDDTRWRAFRARMFREGVLTKTDVDFLQAVWDLTEELKPAAQKVHRELYGHYFKEITAWPVDTPWGTLRGGYVPALVDPLYEAEAGVKNEKQLLTEGADNAFMFPTTGRGFTRSREEAYARPLALDLRLVPQHLDKVLRFIHLEPRVKDVGRLLLSHRFRDRLNAYDPAAKGDMLLPWLQRAASQRVSKASQGWAGRAVDAFFRTLRTRSGLNLMAANVINTLEQFTGLLPARTKVQGRYLRNALWRYVRDHKRFVDEVLEADPFMRTRVTSLVMETQRTIDDLLLNPSKYEQLRDFGNAHGYFMQTATQGMVDFVVWGGAYEQASEAGASHPEAVRQAAAVVRQTQGSFAPEDMSRVEVQTPFVRAFVMFFGYFNMLANLNGTELGKVARDMGLRRGAGRALFIYTYGFMAPAVLAEVLRQSLGGWENDDDEAWIDDAMWLFFASQGRALTAMVPGVGAAANYAIGKFSGTVYGDRISVSPAISVLEGAGRAPYSVYKAIVEGGRVRTAVRDTLDALALLTGLPFGAVKRPAGYLADVLEERETPESGVELARGLVSGRSQAER